MDWKHFGRIHKYLYKFSGGRWGARMGWIDVALVEMTGRKSGKLRTVPLACYPYRDSVVVSASNSGKETHPAWYLNLRDNPAVTVQLGRERFEAEAVEVPPHSAHSRVFSSHLRGHRVSGPACLAEM